MKRLTAGLASLVLAGVWSLGVSSASAAVDMTGTALLTACSAIDEADTGDVGARFDRTLKRDECVRYLQGVVDTYDDLLLGLPRPAFCPPGGVTVEQAIRIVVKYLRDHPQSLHERGSTLVLLSLNEAFPCATK